MEGRDALGNDSLHWCFVGRLSEVAHDILLTLFYKNLSQGRPRKLSYFFCDLGAWAICGLYHRYFDSLSEVYTYYHCTGEETKNQK